MGFIRANVNTFAGLILSPKSVCRDVPPVDPVTHYIENLATSLQVEGNKYVKMNGNSNFTILRL